MHSFVRSRKRVLSREKERETRKIRRHRRKKEKKTFTYAVIRLLHERLCKQANEKRRRRRRKKSDKLAISAIRFSYYGN